MADLTEAQRQAVEKAKERRKQREAEIASIEPQRARAVAQGLTFGFSDEIEARLRSAMGQGEYSELVDEARGLLKEYQQADPVGAFGYEIGGALLPSLVAGLFSGGTGTAVGLGSVAAKYPTIAKVVGTAAPTSVGQAAKIGAIQGGITGVGKGETLEERALMGGFGTVGGAAGGAAVQAVAPKILGGVTGLIDATRRRFGGKASKAVEQELLRLVDESGMSVDEVIEGVASGRLMTENRTMLDAIRSFRASGGRAATRLQEGIKTRPELTREQAMQQIQEYLAKVDDPNILRAMQASDDEARAIERASYGAFKDVQASPDVVAALEDAINRVPELKKPLNRIFQAREGKSPMVISEDGTVVFERTPTMQEVEIVRQTLSKMATREFRSPQGIATVGEEFADVQRGLREALDRPVVGPSGEEISLAATRQQAATVRSARQSFDEGISALGKSPDRVAIEFAKLRKPEDIKSYRAGVVQAIKDRMSTGSRKSMMENLSDPTHKAGAILRIVTPEDQIDDVLKSVQIAADAQAARTKISGGSDTKITAGQQARQGMGITDEEAFEAFRLNPLALLRVGKKMVAQGAPSLTDKQRDEVVKVLISDDPQFVASALRDEGRMAAAMARIQQISDMLVAGGQKAVTVGAVPTASSLLVK